MWRCWWRCWRLSWVLFSFELEGWEVGRLGRFEERSVRNEEQRLSEKARMDFCNCHIREKNCWLTWKSLVSLVFSDDGLRLSVTLQLHSTHTNNEPIYPRFNITNRVTITNTTASRHSTAPNASHCSPPRRPNSRLKKTPRRTFPRLRPRTRPQTRT